MDSCHELTDTHLATRIATGDGVAFEQLVRRHSGRIQAMALQMLGDRADAEDVVQDALITAWHRIDELAEPAALRAWLFQIARRRCLIILRARRTRRTEPVPTVPEHRSTVGAAAAVLSDPERMAEASEGMLALRMALAGLPHPQRDVWLLAEVGGLSYMEIARRVGTGEQAVRGRLSRARANLAEVLSSWR